VLVRVNGSEHTVPDGTTVHALLQAVLAQELADRPRGIAVALEGEVVPRSLWSTTAVAPGSVVEVLTAVQGG
jgi:sulfur carrier protein